MSEGGQNQVMVQRVTLDIKTAVAALVIIVAGVTATVGGLHMIANDLRYEMKQLDEKWQQRVLGLEERLRGELKDLADSMPPPEVQIQLDHLERANADLKTEVRHLHTEIRALQTGGT
jgi:hypothetical protein